ncbi:MAG: hypothetical protein AB1552_14070 [Nitrospirota bacterium]
MADKASDGSRAKISAEDLQKEWDSTSSSPQEQPSKGTPQSQNESEEPEKRQEQGEKIPAGFKKEDWQAMSDEAKKQINALLAGFTQKTSEYAKSQKQIEAVWEELERQGVVDFIGRMRSNPDFQRDPKAFLSKVAEGKLPQPHEKSKSEADEWDDQDIDDKTKSRIIKTEATLEEIRKKVESLEQGLSKREKMELLSEFEAGLAEIEEMAKKEGLELTDETRDKITDYIAATGADFQDAFEAICGPEIRKSLRVQIATKTAQEKPATEKSKFVAPKLQGPTSSPTIGPKRPADQSKVSFSREDFLKTIGATS